MQITYDSRSAAFLKFTRETYCLDFTKLVCAVRYLILGIPVHISEVVRNYRLVTI